MLDDARDGFDHDVRPQDDLFGHVNGSWLATAEIPEDRSSWGPFVTLSDRAEQQVKQLVDDITAAVDQGRGADDVDDEDRKIADLYASFMDTDRIAALGTTPLRDLLTWADEVTDVASLSGVLGRAERVGSGGLFGSYVNTDAKDSDRYLFHIGQGGLGLPDESYYREEKFAETREKYEAYLTSMFALAGLDESASDGRTPAQRAAAVLAVETRLASGHWERAETRDIQKTYNLRSRDELVALCPAFDFAAYVDGLRGYQSGEHETLREVVVRQPSYLEHLSSALEEVDVADWRDWLRIRLVRSMAAYLPEEFVETNFDFYGRTLAGTPQMRARWKRGVSFVEGAIGEAVGKRYVARHFPPVAKERMDELVANLLEAYRRSITDLDWMSEDTKTRAFDKLDKFTPKIGYPEEFRDYSALEVDRGDLLANARAASAFATDRELRKVGSPVDRAEWFMLPQTVNAYYNPGTNEICFPAGILQRPFFDAEVPDAENYGGIGAVIGHEIGHGFDDQGAQYDGDGNLEDWWTPADKERFGEKSKALISQYDGLEPRNLPGEKVNGSLTVGENIGDLGGLTIAIKAYRIACEDTDLTPEEVTDGVRDLMLSWAHVWRTKRRRELDLQYLTVDPHSPPEFRANIVRNVEEFHQIFETRPGDGLWLEEDQRVAIW
ncbi:peptidase M13 [Nocardioidaceae bacterium]|nr:peptidase M13 [Nocardioidaceae bacterium]